MTDAVEFSTVPPAGWTDCVERGVFGVAGGRYRRQQVAMQLRRLAAPVYLSRRVRGEIVGTCLLDRRDLRVDGEPVEGWYRALLMVRASHQRAGHGRALVSQAAAWLDARATRRAEPILSFGCVDVMNPAPLSALQSTGGYRQIAALSGYLLYRQWPRRRAEVIALAADDARLIATEHHHETHARLADCSPRRTPGAAWLVNGGIVLSARPTTNMLTLTNPGMPARLVAGMLRPVPSLRRRFDPRRFVYLGIGALTVAPGAERHFARFVSALLADHGLHYAMVMLDPDGETHRRLEAAGQLSGVFVGAPQQMAVMARWHGAINTSPPSLGSPHHLSPADL